MYYQQQYSLHNTTEKVFGLLSKKEMIAALRQKFIDTVVKVIHAEKDVDGLTNQILNSNKTKERVDFD